MKSRSYCPQKTKFLILGFFLRITILLSGCQIIQWSFGRNHKRALNIEPRKSTTSKKVSKIYKTTPF